MLTSFERGVSKEWVDFHQMDPLLYKEEGPLSETVIGLKSKAVAEAVEAGDWNKVREYCRTLDGLVSNTLRQAAWPALVGVSEVSLSLQTLDQLDTNDLAEHKDEDQVSLDIKRLFTVSSHLHSLPPAGGLFATVFLPEDIEELRRRLFGLVVRVLRKYPCLHYYQGFHDVASVVLMVFYNPLTKLVDETLAFAVLERLAVLHLRDFMLPSIDLTINHLKVMAALLEEIDPQLFHLACVSSQSFQCTSGQYYDYKFIEPLLAILTIFSHDLSNMSLLLPLWDFVLSYNSVAANLYIYVAALQHFKDDIMTKLEINDDPDTALYYIDPSQTHAALSASNLFENITNEDLLQILRKAKKLIEAFPLLKLTNKSSTTDIWFGQFNTESVLVTSSALDGPTDMLHLFDSTELSRILERQHQQQQAEAAQASELLAHHIEQSALTDSITSTEDDIDSTRMGLLSSSLSSLGAVSNSLNHTLVNKSSVIFRKIFSHSSDSIENEENSVAKRNKRAGLHYNIYKISVSVGFVGFLIHCLLRHSELSIRNYTFGPLGLINSISSSFESLIPEALTTVRHGIREVAGGITSKFSDVVDMSLDLTQIGLGTLRDSIHILST